jgi:FMN-dependent NADH-azoreductase
VHGELRPYLFLLSIISHYTKVYYYTLVYAYKKYITLVVGLFMEDEFTEMNILHIVSSARGAESFSHKLGDAIVEKLRAANAQSSVVVHDVAALPFPHLGESQLASFFTPEDKRSPELAATAQVSDTAIDELMQADAIVIGVPMYNFGIPSTLKSWIDHIARAGKTFSYGANGPEGLVKNKKVYLAISSGGVYSEGAMKAMDYTESYLRSVLGFLGMTDISVVRVEGVNIPGVQDDALAKAVSSLTDLGLAA